MMWVDNDLTAFSGGSPAFNEALVGYSQSDGSQHVNFIDRTNWHVHELYRSADPAAQWVDNDLTALAGGSPASISSILVGYSENDGSQHVNFIDDNGHIHELYRSADPAAQWVDNDLTALAGGIATLVSTLLVGYSQSDGSQHVNFIDHKSNHVHELYRSADPAAKWVDNDLTALAGGSPAFGALNGYSQSDGSQHVHFTGENGHLHELYRSADPAAQWVDNDLTAFTGVTPFSVTHGYSQSDGSQHVNFTDNNGHVHELYRSADPAAQWVDNDLTAFSGGSPAFGDPNGYSQDDGSQHVNFLVQANWHVHELYRSADPAAQWVDNDLTAFSGGSPAFGGPLNGYSQDDGSQHVNFTDENGHVHELYRNP